VKKFMYIFMSLVLLSTNSFAENVADFFPKGIGSFWVYYDGEKNIKTTIEGSGYDESNNCYRFIVTLKILALSLETIRLQLIEFETDKISMIAQRANSLGAGFGDWKSYENNILLISPLKKGNEWFSSDNDATTLHTIIGYEDVNTEAGFFRNTLKIKEIITYLDKYGKQKIFAKKYLYFAKNIGLVKEEVIQADGKIFALKILTDYSIK
jgi:hypothetical protein